MTRNKVINYRNRIKLIKILLFVALAVVGGSISLDLATTPTSKSKKDKMEINKIDKNIIENPHIIALDKDNNPYKITAQSGEQLSTQEALLQQVEATYLMDGKNCLQLKSNQAKIDQGSGELSMSGDIDIKFANDANIKAQQSILNYKNKCAHGENGIVLQTDSAYITADKFEITPNYKQVILSGDRVKTKVKLNDKK